MTLRRQGQRIQSLRFIDLFAGLGGFHLALSRLDAECVFASEVDEPLADIYQKNFGIEASGDIRNIRPADIPNHDVLCAGFPCQPFSKAGEQLGFLCPESGDLFDYVLSILRVKKPQYVILENVPNLEKHNHGETWDSILSRLKAAGYETSYKLLSPHQFGIPQIRERLFLVGSRDGLTDFVWPRINTKKKLSLRTVLNKRSGRSNSLPKDLLQCLRLWQEFLKLIPRDEELSAFPIWAMESGCTYPFEKKTPYAASERVLRKYRGSFGASLRKKQSKTDLLDALPPYARDRRKAFPAWKIDFIRANRSFFSRNKRALAKWVRKVQKYAASYQKFEWNCKGEARDIFKNVVQFRASGIRVKRPTTAPSLVAMTNSLVPVIAWQHRYMTIRECARLQSIGQLRYLPQNRRSAIRALGNAVNAEVVYRVARKLLSDREQKRSAKIIPNGIRTTTPRAEARSL